MFVCSLFLSFHTQVLVQRAVPHQQGLFQSIQALVEPANLLEFTVEGGDSCGVAMGEGTGDSGAGGEAGGEGSIDQSERRMGDSGGD